MREILTFELEQADVPTGLLIERAQTLKVCRGTLWLTVAGDSTDHWLREGEALELPARSIIWVSAAQAGGRFNLARAATPSRASRFVLEQLAAWLGRRRSAAVYL